MEETPTKTDVRRRRLAGVVTSAKAAKTVTVQIDRLFPHRRFKRVVRRSRKYLVDDPQGLSAVGDTVEIEETRPVSKRKRWRVMKILRRAPSQEAETAPEAETENDKT